MEKMCECAYEKEKKENAPEGKNFEMLTLIGMEWNVNETCT